MQRARSRGWGWPMRSPEQIAERIALPDGLERHHVVEGARLVIEEGLLPRDGAVLDRARKLAAAETPEARETWTAALAVIAGQLPETTVSHWFGAIRPTADGDRLVLMCPRRQVAWIAKRYAGLIRDAVEAVDIAERWRGMALRPYGPEPQAQVQPAPTYREQRRAA